ncbi:MAG: putative baseplate assembly protein [Leptolyngbyaceae cyanobacterium]
MPIRPPALDDRSFDDLVEELLARIAAHTPEYTNPRLGDPGRTMLELFAWLGDTLLYRANLIPERQRLAFLRLLGMPLRPAIPAKGVVSVAMTSPQSSPEAITIRPLATLPGPVPFETRTELTILPVTAAIYYKRPLDTSEDESLRAVVQALPEVYGLSPSTPLVTATERFSNEELGLNPPEATSPPPVQAPRSTATPYVTTAALINGQAEPTGFNVAERTVDGTLWIALLAGDALQVDATRTVLGESAQGGRTLLNVGFTPTLTTPSSFDDGVEQIGPRGRIPHTWAISTGRKATSGEPDYLPLTVVETTDTTVGLTQPGILQLALPAASLIGAPSNDVRLNLQAGVGDRPPRVDDPAIAERIVTWLRLRPSPGITSLSLSWLGINAVEIDQRQTLMGKIVGQSDGTGSQVFSLPGQSVDPDTFQLQVEAPEQGYQLWQRVEDLALVGRDALAYTLDSEAGTVQLGDGVRGVIPPDGMRIRVAMMRSGGGIQGNLPPGSLTAIQATTVQNRTPSATLQVQQPLSTQGGEAAETLAVAEQRIPERLRHRDRAITTSDYEQLANRTPGVSLGRVEVLPRFKPQQRQSGVPGVISVMVIPQKNAISPPNPQADRPTLETVYAYLDERRPLATELYVIACDYVPLGLAVGVDIQQGFGQETVLLAVREALYQFLWPLAPGDSTGMGWARGKTVDERELEVAIARVTGISRVNGVRLFTRTEATAPWTSIAPMQSGAFAPATMTLESWQLPELLSVVTVVGSDIPTDLNRVSQMGGNQSGRTQSGDGGIFVPVVPEVC